MPAISPSLVLSEKILAQILLMQNVLCNLPNEESIFSFVCRGLVDMPGVARVSYQTSPDETGDGSAIRFPLLPGGADGRELVIALSDPTAFAPYAEFVSNFCFMVGVILEERSQRRLNEEHKAQLELRVEERTRQLNEEIAERQLAIEQLRATANELARSNKDLERFAYVAAHDLQEPLRTVRCFAQLLAKRCRGQIDSEADECINFLVDGAGRMSDLVSRLLEYSRIRSTEQRMILIDSQVALADALAALGQIIASTGVVVTSDPLPSILGDLRQLTQLFQNLISNAIKFRSENTVPRIHISAAEQEGKWLFSVSDNGIGIDPRHHEKVFEIFRRLHGPQKYPGTGIGLAICKRIIERHGGQIWIESRPGNGTTFHFTLPKRTDIHDKYLSREKRSFSRTPRLLCALPFSWRRSCFSILSTRALAAISERHLINRFAPLPAGLALVARGLPSPGHSKGAFRLGRKWA